MLRVIALKLLVREMNDIKEGSKRHMGPRPSGEDFEKVGLGEIWEGGGLNLGFQYDRDLPAKRKGRGRVAIPGEEPRLFIGRREPDVPRRALFIRKNAVIWKKGRFLFFLGGEY